jgi:DNA-binding MarR family transcriptional regulator
MSSPDADSPLADQLLSLTRRLHRIHKHQLEERGVGITPAQSRLLRTLAHHIQHHGSSPRMADLAENLEVVPRAVTTLVDALEASGKVRRAPDPENRRVIRIELTDVGRKALSELRGARRAAAEEILAPLTDEQRTVLGGLLDTLTEGAGPPPDRRC